MTWTKEGQPLNLKEVAVRTSDRDSVFFIRKAERKHSGKYEISVKILDELEDKATIDLRVIGKGNEIISCDLLRLSSPVDSSLEAEAFQSATILFSK